MSRVQSRKYILLMLLLSVVAACGVYPETSRVVSDSPLSALPSAPSPLRTSQAAMVPPTPPLSPLSPLATPEPTRTPTPTPDGNVGIFTATPSVWTPKPPPVVVNLAEGWPETLIFTFFVERADGREEIYMVPIVQVPAMRTEMGMVAYEAYKQRMLQLGPRDRLVYECASSYMLMVPEQFQCLGRKRVKLNVPP
jgi:hypothetical protein